MFWIICDDYTLINKVASIRIRNKVKKYYTQIFFLTKRLLLEKKIYFSFIYFIVPFRKKYPYNTLNVFFLIKLTP